MKIRIAVVMALFASAPLMAQAPALTDDEVLDFAKRVKSVRAEPAALKVRVGQKMNLASITVTVLDSAGKVRGRLAGFDFAMRPGQAAILAPGSFTGGQAGTDTLFLRYPRRAWEKVRTGTRPEAKVIVTVTP